MLALREFRSRSRGLSDLLPYAGLVAPGIVLCKDGTFLAGFAAQGQDTASSTADELAFVSAQFNNAVKLLGTGWMLHMDAVRSRYRAYSPREDSHFPDPITRLIDEERRAFFDGDVFRTRTVITLAYKPDLGAEKLSSATKSGGTRVKGDSLERALGSFQNTLMEFEDALAAVLRLRRLGEYVVEEEGGSQALYSDLLTHLQLCATGVDQPIRVPRTPMYLDALIGSEDLIGGLTPRIGDQEIAVLGIDGLPQESWPVMLSVLDGLQLQYRFSTRFICLDQYDAQKEIDSYRKGWKQSVYKFFDKLFNNTANARANRDAQSMVDDAEVALSEVQSGYVGAGYLTSNIVLLDPDRENLHEWARELRRELLAMGFGCRIESINAVDAWLGTHPGNWFANIRRPLVNTLNLADLLPLASVWVGEKHCPCPFYPPRSPALMVCTTQGSTPTWFNLHVGDVGHAMIFGPIGAGKSTLLALIAAQFRRYARAQVFAFDKGMSLYALCAGVGGTHYEIGRGTDLAFAPLQHIDDPSDMAWAEEWIATLVELQGLAVGPGYRNAIHNAMVLLRANPRNMRSLTAFVHFVQEPAVAEALLPYTQQGTMGRLLDAEEDNLGLSPFLVFEIEELMNLGDKNLIPVLLYIFRRIERALNGQPTLILLDEAWLMLGHPVFRAKLREWLKVLRKANCSVVMATQSLSDAKNSGIMDVLVESCQTKIFLPNITARQEVQAELYRGMGLNNRQIEIIASAMPKRDYYVVTPNGKQLMQLALQRKSLSFLGVSDKDSVSRIKELQSSHGEAWTDAWLNERGGIAA